SPAGRRRCGSRGRMQLIPLDAGPTPRCARTVATSGAETGKAGGSGRDRRCERPAPGAAPPAPGRPPPRPHRDLMGPLPGDTAHNLPSGVLPLQADIITSDQFVEACTTWAARKGAPLADVLTDRGWVAPTERATIEHLMQLKLKKFGGDAHASLTAVA